MNKKEVILTNCQDTDSIRFELEAASEGDLRYALISLPSDADYKHDIAFLEDEDNKRTLGYRFADVCEKENVNSIYFDVAPKAITKKVIENLRWLGFDNSTTNKCVMTRRMR